MDFIFVDYMCIYSQQKFLSVGSSFFVVDKTIWELETGILSSLCLHTIGDGELTTFEGTLIHYGTVLIATELVLIPLLSPWVPVLPLEPGRVIPLFLPLPLWVFSSARSVSLVAHYPLPSTNWTLVSSCLLKCTTTKVEHNPPAIISLIVNLYLYRFSLRSQSFGATISMYNEPSAKISFMQNLLILHPSLEELVYHLIYFRGFWAPVWSFKIPVTASSFGSPANRISISSAPLTQLLIGMSGDLAPASQCLWDPGFSIQ